MGQLEEVRSGERFSFGRNWSLFLKTLTEDRIESAVQSLKEMLGGDQPQGWTFLDVGSGSGLFSLAAHRMGARVYSFDYDPDSVRCTSELRSKFGRGSDDWQITTGSILDRDFVKTLPQADVVYSWGVLHHTGGMWSAIENTLSCVKPGGTACVALYNDQGLKSRYWTEVKKLYNKRLQIRLALILAHFLYPFGASLAFRMISGRFSSRRRRGMTYWYDYLDWLGGYPFEVAKAPDVDHFFEAKGFHLKWKKLTKRSGCNEWAFQKEGSNSASMPG